MRSSRLRPLGAVALSILVGVSTSGCSLFTRLSEVGSYPALSPVTNPQSQPGYRPVNMPMPAPQPPSGNANSLWRAGAKAFFRDIRAKDVGDTLTVRLNLDDNAKFDNKTTRARNDNEAMGLDSLFGYELKLGKIFPRGVDNADLFRYSSKSNTAGNGAVDRKEKMEITFAAMVTQVLPNGSMAILGRQEIRVNYELRELSLTGIVRPQDIDTDNSVSHEKIAEMRVGYGGRGTLSDLQEPRWGTQLMDILLPF